MALELLPWQARALETPLDSDLVLAGGRGGGKSYALAALLLQFVAMHPGAPLLVLRRTFPGLQDFIGLTMQLFPQADPGARYSSQTHVWRFSNGSTCELGVLDAESDFVRYQGRSFSLIAIDEAGQFPRAQWIDLLRSCLRGPIGQPVRMILAANPGGVGHGWLHRRYVAKATPWLPFVDELSGRPTIVVPSTYRMNDRIDRDAYEKQLKAATTGDSEMHRAWADGDWAIAAGAYFSEVIDERRVMVEPWRELPREAPAEELPPGVLNMLRTGRRNHWPEWNYFLAMDYGVAAPTVCYLVAESPGATVEGRWFPRGSLVLLDECDTRLSDNDLNSGTGLTVPELADKIRAMCAYWGVPARGCADDSIFARTGSGSNVSIADEFRKCGVSFSPAGKADRISGWERMRLMLAAAGSPDRPGLYVSRNCTYWWLTVPFLTRDKRRREDIDSGGPDHGADACRYAVAYRKPAAGGLLNLPRVHA